MCDQVVCLISPDHAQSIVWKDGDEDVSMDSDDEESDRLFTFEVSKTNEQEESVTSRPGFNVISRFLMSAANIDPPQMTSSSICIPDTCEWSGNEEPFHSKVAPWRNCARVHHS